MKKKKVLELIDQALEARHARPIITLCNDSLTALDDTGWGLIAPFGEHPKTRVYREDGQVKEQKFIQVLDNDSADAMLAKENSLFRTLKRALVGIPVYKGHGDLSEIDPKALGNTADKIKLGVVDQVRKSARGIEAHFALDNDGAEAVAAGFKYPSAFWYVLPNGRRGDAILAKPFRLISVALTPYPNISGVESLANARQTEPAARETKNENTKMKELLMGWLAARGIVLANDASETAVLKAVQDSCSQQADSITALGNEKTSLAGQITALTNERNAEKQRAEQAATALANEQTARKSERSGRAGAVTDLAIQTGRLAVSERDTQITALTNAKDEAEFTAAADKLLKAARRFKVQDAANVESGKALANASDEPRAEYAREFSKALPECGQDPVKAHAKVMALPGLADKLRVKKN